MPCRVPVHGFAKQSPNSCSPRSASNVRASASGGSGCQMGTPELIQSTSVVWGCPDGAGAVPVSRRCPLSGTTPRPRRASQQSYRRTVSARSDPSSSRCPYGRSWLFGARCGDEHQVEDWQAGSPRPAFVSENRRASALRVAGEAARGRGLDGQHGVQSGDRQDAAGPVPGPVQDEPTVGGAQLVINAMEHNPAAPRKSSPDKSSTISE